MQSCVDSVGLARGEEHRLHHLVPVVIARKPLKFLHDRRPGTVPATPVVAVEAGRVRTVALRQVAPRRAGAKHEEDAVHHPPVMHPFQALVLVGKHRAEDLPFRVGHVVSVAAHASNSLWIAFAKK